MNLMLSIFSMKEMLMSSDQSGEQRRKLGFRSGKVKKIKTGAEGRFTAHIQARDQRGEPRAQLRLEQGSGAFLWQAQAPLATWVGG